jgi:hypothetical protein
VPEREVVEAAAFQHGQRDRGQERQRLNGERQRKQVDLANELPIGCMQEDGAGHQQATDHRLPERREIGAAASGAALGCAYERQAVLDQAETDRAGDGPLQAHGGEHRAQHLAARYPNPQPVEPEEMRDRHDEGGEDRNGQDLVGNGDADDGNERHPDQVEQRDQHADAFGAEPGQPAEREFALLLAGE